MIVERIAEYYINPDNVAVAFHDEYQEFIQKSDNEDTWDFTVYFIETYGLSAIVNELELLPESHQDYVY
jgi:hypothetical protein